jgi:uncharacterized delta-60 repeat protein
LDPTFGKHGFAVYETIGSTAPRVNGLIVQPNGGIVIGAGSRVVRYRADGRRDPDFKVQRGPTVALALQRSGKILWATGESVRQLLPNGREQNFGGGKVGEGAVLPGYEISAMAVQADGKVLVGGRFKDGRGLALARLLPDGRLDSSFGSGGMVAVALSPPGMLTGVHRENRDRALSIAPLVNGEILVAGEAGLTAAESCISTCVGSNWHAVVLEFSADGSLDPSFGTGGVLSTSEHWGSAFGLLSGRDGGTRFLLGGPKHLLNPPGAIDGFAVGALSPGGAWRRGFGKGGVGVSGFFAVGAEETLARASCAGPGGDMVVAGGTGEEPAAFRLLWLRPDGTLDRRFGRGGIVTTPIAGSSDVLPGAVQVASAPHGRVVAAGFTKDRVLIARYVEQPGH